jgi:hypothetical protein
MLVLEVKGEDSAQNRAKRDELKRWVDAVNEKGGFGVWAWDVVFEPAKMQDVIHRHAGVPVGVSGSALAPSVPAYGVRDRECGSRSSPRRACVREAIARIGQL